MADLVPVEIIADKIFFVWGQKVMLDRDLAKLYRVSTGRLNEQVRRNIKRFPGDFMFQLTREEFKNWKSQIAISNSDEKLGRFWLPGEEQVKDLQLLFSRCPMQDKED